MIITRTVLSTLYTGFSTAFQSGFSGVTPQYNRVAQVVPSTTRVNEYGWMADLPGIREWLGDRLVKNLETNSYQLRNKSFESTVGVKREDIEDDNLGMFGTIVTEMGRLSAVFPDEQVWPLLTNGWAGKCYDGKPFFSEDHPVLDKNGKKTTASNDLGGNGTPWFLLDTTRAVKPLIWQTRKAFNLVRMDAETDEHVFTAGQFRYGVDGRAVAGYGFWQLATGSKQELTPETYAEARALMLDRRGDNGRPLGLQPNLLVVPSSLEGVARKILLAENDAAGSTNVWKGTAEPFTTPWLAAA
ncbi:Mu-like prophage major head subunit gpT family protein [Labrys neptuniae]|uniref:Mu-like prophage major head subunit gpT family protein n=1 Tax=Labrys neptuniae TaxID=376174 RepID=A0ABV3PHL6_9HYPH